jgi:photosystem II stability/assembly factor-like uncharacterized protein
MLPSLALALALAAPQPKPARPAAPPIEAPRLAALKARAIGPAIMGGRVSDIAVDPSDPDTFYVGLATGGVMKTQDGGFTFRAIFEREAVASIGAVAVAPSDPRVVWVGTGEANDRNSSGWGNGVYRSTDGGETWKHVGLPRSFAIARIAVDPKDPAAAWVAAMGNLWVPGGERGLYRTSDAGATWKKVLSAPAPHDALTGAGDVVLDPSRPGTVYAALYARRRSPWAFEYGAGLTGADAGGIFKSSDGGRSWRKLAGGLPGRTGRIGLDLARSRPDVVYAVVQSDEGGTSGLEDIRSRSGGVFRSDDGGETWVRRSPLDPRPFYFSQIRADPLNPDRVYVLGFMLHVSDDGGRTFREDLFQKVHADCHALAIVPVPEPKAAAEPPGEPAAPRPPVSKRLLLGTDGGAYLSLRAGRDWAHLDRMAAGEFYKVNVDQSRPYRICGGLQDNLTWVGPSRTWSRDGIVNADWIDVGGGDGFSCVFDPSDPDLVYAESQEGFVHRLDLRTGERKHLRPEPAEGQPRVRFHWNAPLIGSRHSPGALYLGGNRVFRLEDRGERWTAISPDLSTRDPARTVTVGSGAEVYGVVFALAESPLRAGLLWAGTDDGKVWVTEDEGRHWSDLTQGLPPAARGQWVSRIEPSGHDPKVAYLAVDAHRSGQDGPLLWRTADTGRTWQSVAGDLPGDAPVQVVRESPRNPALLFAGTEHGLFVTFDRGGRWVKLGGLPTVAVDDIGIQARERDLIVGTHGRSLYVLDDFGPLEDLTPEVAARPEHLFPPRPAFGRYLLPGWEDSNGKAVFRGENPPEGALLTFWLREPTGDPVEIEIANALGQPVARFTFPEVPGLTRFSWDLRPTKDLRNEYGGQEKERLLPAGEYQVRLKHGKAKQSQKLVVEIAAGIETR